MHQFFKFTTNALMMKRVFKMAGCWPVLILRFNWQRINRALKFPEVEWFTSSLTSAEVAVSTFFLSERKTKTYQNQSA